MRTKELRPDFQLQEVKDADFDNIRAQHADGVPRFMLRTLEGFVGKNSQPLTDTRLKSVERKEF